MDTLPAHIADMCGLVMKPAPTPEPAAPTIGDALHEDESVPTPIYIPSMYHLP